MIEPVEKSIEVGWDPETSFDRFTASISDWWPIETHSVGREKAESVVFEPGVGGRVYERQRDGSEADWARVTEWDRPHGFVLDWHPSRDPSTAQRLEIRFFPIENGTRVELTHSGWEAMGDEAGKARENYAGGWDNVLRIFADAPRNSEATVP